MGNLRRQSNKVCDASHRRGCRMSFSTLRHCAGCTLLPERCKASDALKDEPVLAQKHCNENNQASRVLCPHPQGFGGMAVVIATLGCPGGRGRRASAAPVSPVSFAFLNLPSRSDQPPAACSARRKSVGCPTAAKKLRASRNGAAVLASSERLAGSVELSAASLVPSAASAASPSASADNEELRGLSSAAGSAASLSAGSLEFVLFCAAKSPSSARAHILAN